MDNETKANASEETGPRILTAAKSINRARHTLKMGNALVAVVGIILLALLASSVMHTISLHRSFASARAVSDQVVTAIGKRDGNAARKLGNTKFQSMYTSKQLHTQFVAIEPVTSFSRSFYQQKLVTDKTKVALMYYKYPTKDLAYYIRVAVTQNAKTGAWQLTDITGNADLNTL